MIRTFAFAILLAAGTAANAATVDITAEQVGGVVVLTGSGAIDLSGIGSPPTVFDFTGGPTGSQPQYFNGLGGPADVYQVADTGFTPLSDTVFLLSATGDRFGLQGLFPPTHDAVVGVNPGYASEDPISFVWTVSGTTLAALDLNFGTIAEFNGNTVTLSLVDAAVPLPAPLGLLALGLLGGGAMALRIARHRRRAMGDPAGHAALYGAMTLLAKHWMLRGARSYARTRARGETARIIEYKGAAQ